MRIVVIARQTSYAKINLLQLLVQEKMVAAPFISCKITIQELIRGKKRPIVAFCVHSVSILLIGIWKIQAADRASMMHVRAV
jgi:hypothetical protein